MHFPSTAALVPAFGESGRPVRVTISIGLASYPDERVTDGESLRIVSDASWRAVGPEDTLATTVSIGSPLANMRAYVVDGAKTFVSNGTLCDLLVIVARTSDVTGWRGLSLIVAETDGPAMRLYQRLGLTGDERQTQLFRSP